MRLIKQDLSDFFTKRKYSAGTYRDYTKLCERFIDYLSERMNQPSEKLDLSRILTLVDSSGEFIAYRPINGRIMDEYFQHLYKTSSTSTIIRTRYVLVSFFLFLERNYGFPNPMRKLTFNFKSLESTTRPRVCLSRHDILKFLNAIVTHSNNLKRDLLLFCLLLSTGRRISEVLNLKVMDFDFELNTFRLKKTKSKRQFIFPMMEGMGKAIEMYCTGFSMEPTSYLLQHKEGKPFTRKQVADLFDRFSELANITRFNLHATRRTFATLLYEENVDITCIQQFLDHVKISTTQGYVVQNYVRNYDIKINANQELYRKMRMMNTTKES